jgi:dTDP-4-dehydrorhamnose 3,5-epimerase
MLTPKKDHQTVTPDWEPTAPRIVGVDLKYLPPNPDERGEITEIYRPAWGVHSEPLVFVYQTIVRPGKVKGWVVHRKQDDRIFHSMGTLQWALYDDRADSPTHGMVNHFTVSERRRMLFVIPCGVYHTVRNVGHQDALFINMPTRPYDYADPDKYRLPPGSDLIPFRFDDSPGW